MSSAAVGHESFSVINIIVEFAEVFQGQIRTPFPRHFARIIRIRESHVRVASFALQQIRNPAEVIQILGRDERLIINLRRMADFADEIRIHFVVFLRRNRRHEQLGQGRGRLPKRRWRFRGRPAVNRPRFRRGLLLRQTFDHGSGRKSRPRHEIRLQNGIRSERRDRKPFTVLINRGRRRKVKVVGIRRRLTVDNLGPFVVITGVVDVAVVGYNGHRGISIIESDGFRGSGGRVKYRIFRHGFVLQHGF